MNRSLPSALLLCFFLIHHSHAYTVTQVAASYKDGQVFLKWQNPGASNLKYHVYRSTSPISTSADLASSYYVGNVRDNSGVNIRKSNLEGSTYYFTIDPANGPLAEGTGLYVNTCTDNLAWYYAVVTENANNGQDDTQINPGENSLTSPVQETIAAPQPILQQTSVAGDVTSMQYVIWGNNADAPDMPAFNNVGSFGYNFTFFKRGSAPAPLYVYFRSTDPFTPIMSDFASGRHVLLMDDWLPNGQATDWFGHHEDYDIYSYNNPEWTSGTIKAYTQKRVYYTIHWVINYCPVLADQVYASGSSHNGLGAALTAQLHPELFAAIWTSVTPILVKAVNGSEWENIWCASNKNLATDITDPETGEAFRINDLLDLRHMYDVNYGGGIPYIAGIHGKEDYTVGWVEAKHWYDSVNVSNQGGVWYWDQREHDGDGKQFTDDEIKIDFSRFSTERFYPAFSHCTVNQDPGDGSRNSGSPFGAINGFLDWFDDKLVDDACKVSAKIFIKDMTVGGVLQPQYDSCFADVTFRRVQNFHPEIGAKLVWWVMSASGQIMQQGNMIYDGKPISIQQAKILRNGSFVRVKLKGCDDSDGDERDAGPSLTEGDVPFPPLNSDETELDAVSRTKSSEADEMIMGSGTNLKNLNDDDDNDAYPSVHFYRSGSGYVVETKLDKPMDVLVQMTDMTGRIHIFRREHMVDGSNEFNIDAYRGNYLLTLYSPQFTYQRKISF